MLSVSMKLANATGSFWGTSRGFSSDNCQGNWTWECGPPWHSWAIFQITFPCAQDVSGICKHHPEHTQNLLTPKRTSSAKRYLKVSMGQTAAQHDASCKWSGPKMSFDGLFSSWILPWGVAAVSTLIFSSSAFWYESIFPLLTAHRPL